MNRNIRLMLLVICAVQIIFGLLFAFQTSLAASLWPFPGATPLSLTLIGSFFAAAAASTYCALHIGERGALVGIALDYIVILAPVGVFSLQIAGGNGGIIFFAITCFIGALFGLWLFSYSWSAPIRDPHPMPRLVYWSFFVFIIALVIAGGSLVFKVPNLLPWVVTPELSVLFGWMFLGAAVYFTYGLLKPSWSNAAGQLAGFLVYDVVLLLPFIQRTPNLPEHFVVSRIIYLIIVIYSGLLATYYLLINPDTRLFSSRRLVPA